MTFFCVDYHKLNDITLKDAYLLPHIDDTLDALLDMQWFSTLKIKSSYWQIEMDEVDRQKMAFVTCRGYTNSMLCLLDSAMLLLFSNA